MSEEYNKFIKDVADAKLRCEGAISYCTEQVIFWIGKREEQQQFLASFLINADIQAKKLRSKIP